MKIHYKHIFHILVHISNSIRVYKRPVRTHIDFKRMQITCKLFMMLFCIEMRVLNVIQTMQKELSSGEKSIKGCCITDHPTT